MVEGEKEEGGGRSLLMQKFAWSVLLLPDENVVTEENVVSEWEFVVT